MYTRYFYWQFVAVPLWLGRLAINVQIALVTFFSVPVMIKTLFAYWHKDSVSYQQGSISGMLQALAMNIISRIIGFIIRCIMLAVWFVVAVITLLISVVVVIMGTLWPLLALAGIYEGVLIILGGGM